MNRLLLFFLLWLPLLSRAQTPVQVVTKVVEKDLPYTPGQSIRINAQKADVTVRGWNRPTVSVRLRLVAKHPDKAVAEREVAYHQYTLQANSNALDLSNRFAMPSGSGKAQSQLKVIYEVNVPEKALLAVGNSFGDVGLHGLSGDVTLKFEFGKLTLDDMAGKLTITSSYGDIEGRGIDAALTLKSEKADIALRDLGGTCRLTSHYGKLLIQPNPQTMKAFSLEVARAETTIQTRSITDFRYDVIATYADIRVPDGVTDDLGKFGSKQTFTYEPPGRKVELVLRSSYANVLIQSDKSLVNR
ncbi:DUF4097 family beta strand repeat-containing protein [Fibrella forsythiae]|uniref:DUF4097 family beta strand repeat protein n=1 Tax=Fibrella forsythiae TaxID=2817061 RepID=A0ABS3JJ98_9BACT|nr:DUF4097 family beta strand repeat-containing protein [Fibrella forsythiae]MBO0949486.1 DUF4097 family beta strand repeat protein [Fibrella forsythiae]